MIMLCILLESNKNNTAFYRSLNSYSYLCGRISHPTQKGIFIINHKKWIR